MPLDSILLLLYIQQLNMEIIVTNSETNQYIRTITEEEFFKMCGNDKRMFDDYVNRLKKNPYVKYSKENWTIKNILK